MKLCKLTGVALACVAMTACNDTIEDNLVVVDSQPRICAGGLGVTTMHMCFDARYHDGSPVPYHFKTGFNGVWGATKTVEVEFVEHPTMQDGPTLELRFVAQHSVKSDSVGTQYKYSSVRMIENSFLRDESGYQFHGHLVVCETASCESLLSLNNTQSQIDMTFELRADGEIELIAWQ